MIEPAVTVVWCRACRHSDRLTFTDVRFWCAWCQRWTEIDTERVLDGRVVFDGDDFHLMSVPKPGDWQQPLRVPTGWRINWNTLAEEDIDPASDHYKGGRNLFLATNEGTQRAIDIEYRSAEPEPPQEGGYFLRVYPLIETSPEDRQQLRTVEPLVLDWDTCIHQFKTSSRLVLVAELEACLRGERG